MASALSLPLAASAAHQIERAWHLLTVLIRLGRPASPAELAAICAAFSPAPTPEFVELLCWIPGSPLLLDGGGLVMASESALSTLFGFLSGSIAPFASKVPVGLWESRSSSLNASAAVFARKRRIMTSEVDVGFKDLRAKRRLLLSLEGDEESRDSISWDMRSAVNRLHSVPEETELRFAYSVKESSFSSATAGIVSSLIFSQQKCLSPTINNTNVALVNCGVETNEKQGAVLLSGFENDRGSYFGVETDSHIDAKNPEIRKIVEPAQQSDLQYDVLRHYTESTQESPILIEDEYNQLHAQIPTRNESILIDSCILRSQNEDEFIVHAKEIRSNQMSVNNTVSNLPICSQAEPLDEMRGYKSKVHGPSSPIKLAICKRRRKSIAKAKVLKDLCLAVVNKDPCTVLHDKRDSSFLGKQQDNQDCKDTKPLAMRQKIMDNTSSMPINDTKGEAVPKVAKIQIEPKLLPKFEPFVIEEEEGSGGYGIVYKARRKTDGKILAIKCPHAKAHSHHISNEMKMLERFGGKNFVIKYEGSFKSDDLDCFVLEHVEHDRPEILKKDINIFELRWYGYCMFRALASLHKQGVVHRDVKPGNFLYSRKLNKGYLIDFNLANDLQQKFLKNSKLEKDSRMKWDSPHLPNVKLPSSKDLNKHDISKNTKKSKSPQKSLQKIENSKRYGSQAADVSGITSTRDPTSGRTPADRLKQPIPYKGRKELINFLHEAMQSPEKETTSVPASQRKRIAAPQGKLDSRLLILTPMPLRAGSNAVAGAGMFKNKGNGKLKREGPCVGTKGFRAPEVLFKSFHQGCKLDVWSAGVSLLYLIIGKTPFGGDPEQNIKEIAKLRGSEDLWEVAKLHDCEASYPLELFDVRSLRSTDLRDWCALNTRRPDFLDAIPESLFDLVDKCLTVNPRLRISAEDALMHEFFAPCHESLRKQRMLRRSPSSLS